MDIPPVEKLGQARIIQTSWTRLEAAPLPSTASSPGDRARSAPWDVKFLPAWHSLSLLLAAPVLHCLPSSSRSQDCFIFISKLCKDLQQLKWEAGRQGQTNYCRCCYSCLLCEVPKSRLWRSCLNWDGVSQCPKCLPAWSKGCCNSCWDMRCSQARTSEEKRKINLIVSDADCSHADCVSVCWVQVFVHKVLALGTSEQLCPGCECAGAVWGLLPWVLRALWVQVWVCGSVCGCGGWMGRSNLLGWEDIRSHCKEFWQLLSSTFILASTSEFGLGDYSSQTCKEGKDVVDNPHIHVDLKMFFPFGSPCSWFDIFLSNKYLTFFVNNILTHLSLGSTLTEGTLAVQGLVGSFHVARLLFLSLKHKNIFTYILWKLSIAEKNATDELCLPALKSMSCCLKRSNEKIKDKGSEFNLKCQYVTQ